MTARFEKRGRDVLLNPPQTQWQKERARGPLLPMEQPRRRWWQMWRQH